MKRLIKILFFAFIIKPIVFIILGLNIKDRKKLPVKGGTVIAPNHNSHLDTMVVMSLYPLSIIHKIRPVAAADYFMKNKIIAWISTYCIGIIPLDRSGSSSQEELFKPCHEALDKKDILILFPEGSRGKPEQMTRLKKGLFYLLKDSKDTPVTPIYMKGLGNSLPKGEALFVPFTCDVIVGDPITILESSKQLNNELNEFFNQSSDSV
ncbi:lysophospholipid acyltransferase family protein [Arcobacter sp.]|uniref:lysophospholipid acyltransferase family protein n=1 Tax=Arcobacter sp. TaxID=1872629 RepID=UPI003C76BBCB